MKVQAIAKKKAYAQKQEKQGKNVMAWIFGVLGILAVSFFVYSIWLMS